MKTMKKLGLIVNPVAGMGGKVGLKGSDGEDIIERATELGAVPESGDKTLKALEKLTPLSDNITVLTASGAMGEEVVSQTDLNYEVIHDSGERSTPDDTVAIANKFIEEDVDLILFAGGDGTARNIASAVKTGLPVVGIPAGVKIHSPVYGITPENSGELAYKYLRGDNIELRNEEVIDIEEEAFRRDEIITAVYGYLTVPYDSTNLQNLKSISPQSDDESQVSAALKLIDEMNDEDYYIIGSGSTTAKVMEELDLPVTMLGVDIIRNKKLVAKDVNETDMLEIISGESPKLIVTPMGGQGYLFGRGNPQISAKVLAEIEKDDITIIASPSKMTGLQGRPLLVYTGDQEIDEKISGYYRVILSYDRYKMYKVKSAND